jgi:hypothetical protein
MRKGYYNAGHFEATDHGLLNLFFDDSSLLENQLGGSNQNVSPGGVDHVFRRYLPCFNDESHILASLLLISEKLGHNM